MYWMKKVTRCNGSERYPFKILNTGGEMIMVAGFYKEKPITGYVRRENISIGLCQKDV